MTRPLEKETTEALEQAAHDIEGSLHFLRSGPAVFEWSAREKLQEIAAELWARRVEAARTQRGKP